MCIFSSIQEDLSGYFSSPAINKPWIASLGRGRQPTFIQYLPQASNYANHFFAYFLISNKKNSENSLSQMRRNKDFGVSETLVQNPNSVYLAAVTLQGANNTFTSHCWEDEVLNGIVQYCP